MAIQKNHTFKGIEIPGAYFKIDAVVVKKDGADYTMQMRIGVKKDKEAAECFDVKFESCMYDLKNPDNLIQQAYAYLKRKPEYSRGCDV